MEFRFIGVLKGRMSEANLMGDGIPKFWGQSINKAPHQVGIYSEVLKALKILELIMPGLLIRGSVIDGQANSLEVRPTPCIAGPLQVFVLHARKSIQA